MDTLNRNGLTLTSLKRIPTPNGDVLHALKQSDTSFTGFGEAYFSSIHAGAFKGWKKHRRMTLNIVVPVGAIRFYIVDLREDEWAGTVLLSGNNYQRLTVPPQVWMGFSGEDMGINLLMNLASIEHDPLEAENRPPDAFANLFSDTYPIPYL